MSAYRGDDVAEPSIAVRVSPVPPWLIIALAAIAAALLLRPWVTQRTVSITCERGLCSIAETRFFVRRLRGSVTIGDAREFRTAPRADGVALMVDRIALAHFSFAEAARAHTASLHLTRGDGAAEVQTPFDPLAPLWAVPFLAAAIALRRRPTHLALTERHLRVRGGETLVHRDEVTEIYVTDEPANARWSLVARTRDGQRIALVERALTRSSLDRAAGVVRRAWVLG